MAVTVTVVGKTHKLEAIDGDYKANASSEQVGRANGQLLKNEEYIGNFSVDENRLYLDINQQSGQTVDYAKVLGIVQDLKTFDPEV